MREVVHHIDCCCCCCHIHLHRIALLILVELVASYCGQVHLEADAVEVEQEDVVGRCC